MPLVSRGFSCFSISLKRSVLWPSSCWRRASASIAERPAYASMQPLRPQGHLAPPRFTTTWPISPAAPRPSHGLPSRTSPPPTPVPQKTPIRLWNSRPAPRWNSASVATWTSLPTRTSVPSASFRASASGKLPSQPGRLLGRRRRRRSSRRRRRASRPRRPARADVSTPACSAASRSAAAISVGDVLRPAAGRRRPPRLPQYLAARVDDRRLDLRPAKVYPAAQLRHGAQSMPRRSSFPSRIHRKGRTPVA